MRTTLSLDDDCYTRLQSEMRRRGCTFREIVNESLRRGLEAMARPAPVGRFRVRPVPGGPRPGVNLDDIAGTLEQMEGPWAR